MSAYNRGMIDGFLCGFALGIILTRLLILGVTP
jgi:hypothetical protein